jgi:hypothetical protein
MNWLNYILTYLVAPLIVGGAGAAGEDEYGSVIT